MKALIITDGTESIQAIADLIKGSLEGYNIKICTAHDFQATDLLPADTFFIGCENPSPQAFAYLEELLSHINLAPRKSAVFSIKTKTVKYLKDILKSCEASAGEVLVVENYSDVNAEAVKSEIKNWIKGIS